MSSNLDFLELDNYADLIRAYVTRYIRNQFEMDVEVDEEYLVGSSTFLMGEGSVIEAEGNRNLIKRLCREIRL